MPPAPCRDAGRAPGRPRDWDLRARDLLLRGVPCDHRSQRYPLRASTRSCMFLMRSYSWLSSNISIPKVSAGGGGFEGAVMVLQLGCAWYVTGEAMVGRRLPPRAQPDSRGSLARILHQRPRMMANAALAHLTSRDGGNAKGLSGTILAMCFAAPAHPWTMGEADKGKGPVNLCPAERVPQGSRTLDRQAERDREDSRASSLLQ